MSYSAIGGTLVVGRRSSNDTGCRQCWILGPWAPILTGRGDRLLKRELVITDFHKVFALKVFVSYAWGDRAPDAPKDSQERQELVERLCKTLQRQGWQIFRDQSAMQPGRFAPLSHAPLREHSSRITPR